MDWILMIISLAVVSQLGDESKLLPVLVLGPIAFNLLKSVRRKQDIFSPYIFFSGFYLLWMGGGFAISFFQRAPGSHLYYSRLAFLILLAYLAWMVGLHLPRFRFFSRHPGRQPAEPPVEPAEYDRAMRVCLIALLAGLTFSAFFYIGGALQTLFAGQIEETRISMFFGRGYLYFLAKSINTVIPVYIGMKWYCGKKFNFFDYILLGAAVILIAFPLSRRPVMWFVITLIILFYYLKTKISYSLALTAAGIMLLAVVLIHQLRSPGMSFSDRMGLEVKVHVENIVLFLKNLDLVGDQGIRPFWMGLSMLMPGHQIGFGLWLKETLGMSFPGGGVSVTLIGEGYLGFRVWGVALEAFLIGCLLKITYRRMEESFTLRNLMIYIIILYKVTEAVNYGLALQLISGAYELALVLLIVPPRLGLPKRIK
jgi:oligosaccharide repeat unit polymerase